MSNTLLGRRERKREQTKQGLIQAAVDLFIDKGYDETTIDDIVNSADVAKVTFYYYFKSKEDIVLEIKHSCAKEVLEQSKILLSQKAQATKILHTLIVNIGQWTQKNWQLLEVFVAQRFSPLVKGESCYDQSKASPMVLLIEQIIKHGQKSGHIRKEIAADQTANLVALTILNEQFAWIREGRKKNQLTTRLERCLDFILNGITR